MLNDNQLTSLPQAIGELEKLRFLYIGKNYIIEMPKSISKLTVLSEIDVAGSGSFSSLPSEWGELRSLERLYIDSSIIVPYEIGRRNSRLKIIIR